MSQDDKTRAEIAARMVEIKREQDAWNAALEADTARFMANHRPRTHDEILPPAVAPHTWRDGVRI